MSIKDELAKIEAEADKRRAFRKTATEEQQKKLADFDRKFDEIKISVIAPAMEETRDTLLSKNHGARIDDKKGSITLVFCREMAAGSQIEAQKNTNCVRFNCERERGLIEVAMTKASSKACGPLITSISSRECSKAFVEGCLLDAASAVL